MRMITSPPVRDQRGAVVGVKDDLGGRARRILHTTPPGKSLEEEDFQFMIGLLLRHPRAEEKFGDGVRAIRIEPNGVWGGVMFVAERLDGSVTDFSYRKCLRAPTRRGEVRAACRQAVAEDVIAFKREFFARHADEAGQVACPLTGQLLGWLEAHVDHAPPWRFRRIFASFFRSLRISVDDVRAVEDGPAGMPRRLADTELAERFRQFHSRVAMLRVIAANENLRIR